MNEKSTINKTDYYSQKSLVLRQIERTAVVFSGFAPQLEKTGAINYSYEQGAQMGKSVASSVLTLLALSASFLSKETYDKITKVGEVAFKEKSFNLANQEVYRPGQNSIWKGPKFLCPVPSIQFQGIMELQNFFQEMCLAIFSHPSFRDAELVSVGGGRDLLEFDKGELIEAAENIDED